MLRDWNSQRHRLKSNREQREQLQEQQREPCTDCDRESADVLEVDNSECEAGAIRQEVDGKRMELLNNVTKVLNGLLANL